MHLELKDIKTMKTFQSLRENELGEITSSKALRYLSCLIPGNVILSFAPAG